MEWWLAALCVILGFRLFRYEQALKWLNRQLELIGEGSRIELTPGLRSRNMVGICRRMNGILSLKHKEAVRLERSRQQIRQSISSIAHDIRTPLTAASGYLQMMEGCGQEEKLKRYREVTIRCLRELKDMLEELFIYTKLTDGDFAPPCERTALFPVLCECMMDFYPVLEERGIEPGVDFESEGITVDAWPEGLARIFRNLINNALLHGDGGIRVTQTGKELTFSNLVPQGTLVDTEQIFERFYKEDASRRKGGSGLGLAIVKELMERMGGETDARQEGETLSIVLRFADS